MIHEIKAYSGTCDNCGKTFENWHSGFTIYVDESSCHEEMDNEEWYTGHLEGEHENKHYCPDCFKYDPDIDDKIIVDLSRKKLNSVQAVHECDANTPNQGTEPLAHNSTKPQP